MSKIVLRYKARRPWAVGRGLGLSKGFSFEEGEEYTVSESDARVLLKSGQFEKVKGKVTEDEPADVESSTSSSASTSSSSGD